jgi:putative SOS response-associated peptidase YedK
MCGRFRLARKKEILEERFGAECALSDPDDAEWAARYNVAPGQQIAVVRQDPIEPVRRLERLRWGLVPWWAKEPTIGYKMINARAETAAERPAFGDALLARRCLVPADGFYEWKREGKQKLPFCFAMADDAVFAFAGLWARWRPPQQANCGLAGGPGRSSEGQTLETCAILTTEPNELMRDVHDRMPVILPPESYELWLDPGFHKLSGLRPLLRPYPAAGMRRYRVSERVNYVQNDDAECAAEIGVPSEPGFGLLG